MTPLHAILFGLPLGYAMGVRRGAAFLRVLAQPGTAPWREGVQAVLPVLAVEGGAALVAAAILALWGPAGPWPEILISLPLLAWCVGRAWALVETPVARLFLDEAPRRAAPRAREVLLDVMRRPHRFVARTFIWAPLVHFSLEAGALGLLAFLLAWGVGHVAPYVALAVDRSRGRGRDRGPYLLSPRITRPVFGAAGLVLFAYAFALTARIAVIGLGAGA